MRNQICDVHSHFILPEYYDEVKNNHLTEDTVPLPSRWSAEEHLEYMEELGIEWSLLSLSSPHPYYGDDRRCIALMRLMNERLADLKRQYPDKFGFAAALPHPNNDAAVEEAIYALDVLGANAIKLASNSRGLYVGDPRMNPLFEELNKRKAIIIIHPHRPSQMAEDVYSAKFVPAFEFLCDTTRAVINVIFNGVLERWPDIRFIVPHNGSFLPNIYARLQMTAEQFVQLGKMEPIDLRTSFGRLYYDTSGHTDPNTEFLLTCGDPSHIMYGSDYPFGPRTRAAGSLEKTREYFLKNKKIAPYMDQFLSGNCKRLFGL